MESHSPSLKTPPSSYLNHECNNYSVEEDGIFADNGLSSFDDGYPSDHPTFDQINDTNWQPSFFDILKENSTKSTEPISIDETRQNDFNRTEPNGATNEPNTPVNISFARPSQSVEIIHPIPTGQTQSSQKTQQSSKSVRRNKTPAQKEKDRQRAQKNRNLNKAKKTRTEQELARILKNLARMKLILPQLEEKIYECLHDKRNNKINFKELIEKNLMDPKVATEFIDTENDMDNRQETYLDELFHTLKQLCVSTL